MQIMNLLVLSRRHPFCCVNSSIKTRDTYLPPIPSLTPITQASAASIQKPIRPLGYIVCQTLVTVADLPIPASPQLLCPSVLGDASEGTRSGMSARNGDQGANQNDSKCNVLECHSGISIFSKFFLVSSWKHGIDN